MYVYSGHINSLLFLKEKSQDIQSKLSLKEAELLSAQHSISALEVSLLNFYSYVHVKNIASKVASFVSFSKGEVSRDSV